MLAPSDFDKFTNDILRLYDEYEQSVINDIARRIAKSDMTSTAAWQAQRLTESGSLYIEVLDKVASLTGKSRNELYRAFSKAGIEAINFDDSIYTEAGLNPLPLNLSKPMLQALTAGIEKTNRILFNLTKTTALTSQTAYLNASNLAYLQVASGAFSYDQAIRAAVIKLADSGIEMIDYPTGHKDKVDVAVRRATVTGVSQTVAKMQDNRMVEMGVDLVAVSAHSGARPSHADWQGKIYSRSGKSKKYPDFALSTGYGTGAGLCGWNCRHSYYPFFPGISENAYNEKMVDELNNDKVTYKGKKLSNYEATQVQRGIERDIRKYKRRVEALKSAGQDTSIEAAKLSESQARMMAFVKETGFNRQPAREFVAKNTSKGPIEPPEPPVIVQPPNTPTPPANPPATPPVEPPAIVEIEKEPEKPVATQFVQPELQGRLQPSGIPVSEALDRAAVTHKKTKEQINLALSELDKVHGDGKLPKIPLKQSTNKRMYGAFWTSMSGAEKITLLQSADHTALTLLHELGHFIDHSGLDTTWSTLRGFQAKHIVDIAKKSDWITNITDRVQAFNSIKNEDGKQKYYGVSSKYVSYLLGSKEIFARAYAQYVATRSGNPELLMQLEKLQTSPFPTQWTNEDFKPIAEAFDVLFKNIGWLK